MGNTLTVKELKQKKIKIFCCNESCYIILTRWSVGWLVVWSVGVTAGWLVKNTTEYYDDTILGTMVYILC